MRMELQEQEDVTFIKLRKKHYVILKNIANKRKRRRI